MSHRTPEDVQLKIVELRDVGLTYRQIADETGVSFITVRRVLSVPKDKLSTTPAVVDQTEHHPVLEWMERSNTTPEAIKSAVRTGCLPPVIKIDGVACFKYKPTMDQEFDFIARYLMD